MKPWELFNFQKSITYNTNTLDYNWSVKISNEEKTIYLFTQGSNSVKDIIINLLFFFIPQIRRFYLYFTCFGWQTAFNSCKCLIMNEVLTAINTFPDYKIVCCGHSYGGAGSVLAGIEIYFATGLKPNLITFGTPKPLFLFLTRCITRFFFNEVVQYNHKSDIVSYMPPLPGYWNVKVVRIGKFRFKDLFNPDIHQSYGNENLYKEILKGE